VSGPIPECPYCKKPAECATGADIYLHRPDLSEKKFFVCRPCHAYVGCHASTGKPLGRLANAELRKLKMAAHAVFDPLWKNGCFSRSAAYAWLSDALGISPDECHIGMFDEEQCRKVVDVCAAWAKR
jgi:hypothetical protein